MNDSVKKRGKKVNFGKTKLMVFEKGENTTEGDILIEIEKIEQVKQFVYQGSLFVNDGEHDRDIERKVNGVLLVIMHNRSVSRQARSAIQNGVLIPMLCMVVKAGHGRRKMKVRFIHWRCDRCIVFVECPQKIDERTVMLKSGVV
ncbi:hypothetical protein EVAR_32332_1 [Eumeta japonica]|uniref:Uncharacterized protein n=1 Tax=Eumeta variegata TaxID=151549 RepID=A0A4C1Z805_EUMVA|nr:hypothetical protein EVAR_32332_1 [Eumeta japonica]